MGRTGQWSQSCDRIKQTSVGSILTLGACESAYNKKRDDEGYTFKLKKIDFVVVVAQRLMFSKTPDKRHCGQLTSS